ncbi:uncharacterized protein LOC128864218 isoform X1 [Anastrepha ludens]|uniref:uncharacterized protein LOC128864218 isoform X1 n=1 Tax=Anastrepha ludens TaxID=28586 RepID=UPI0023AF7DA3|nr:uncharacterized protein LOC128864218 isoform X1 [Anastrepha ludens]
MKSKSVRNRTRRRLSRRNAKKQIHTEGILTSAPSKKIPKVNNYTASKAAGVWRDLYESFVMRQCQAQIEYWKQRATHLDQENEELRNQLMATKPVYETSSEEDEEQSYLDGEDMSSYEDAEISPEYLEFRSVTLKHREELRQTRERERMENAEDMSNHE